MQTVIYETYVQSKRRFALENDRGKLEVVLAGEVQSMTIYHPNQLIVGADVMVVSDVDGGANYIHSRLVQLSD